MSRELWTDPMNEPHGSATRIALPLLLTSAACLITLVFWQTLQERDRELYEQLNEARVEHLASFIERELSERFSSLQRMRERESFQSDFNAEFWLLDARNYARDLPGIRALEWADSDSRVRQVVPLEGNEAALGLNLMSEPRRRTALQRARETRQMTVSRIVDLVQGGLGFLVFAPVYREVDDDSYSGMIVGVFDAPLILENILESERLDLAHRVVEGDQVIYESGTWRPIDPNAPLLVKSIDLLDQVWQVEAQSAPPESAAFWSLPRFVLIAGLAGSLLLGLAAASFQSAILNARELHLTNRRLLSEIQERESLARQLRNFFELSVDLFCIANTDGFLVRINSSWTRILGHTEEALLRQPFLNLVHEDDREATLAKLTELTEGDNAINFVNRYRHADGSYRWLSWMSSAATKEGEIFAVAHDITDQRKTMNRLRNYADELRNANEALEQKNRELDEFTYVASHDLQEPLRKLISFSQLLEKDVAGKLSPNASRDLEFIVDASRRMQGLVQDLLLLSRVGRSEIEFGNVDMQEAAKEACRNLSTAIEESGAVVDTGELPEVLGDRRMMIQLLQNLIGNAIKFSRTGETPRVEIRARPQGGMWEFSVSDNGIGIEPRHVDQIFTPFKRLHGRGAYAGSGIGLSIVKRIAERHGGRVDVESRPGEGSTFRFSIPDFVKEATHE